MLIHEPGASLRLLRRTINHRRFRRNRPTLSTTNALLINRVHHRATVAIRAVAEIDRVCEPPVVGQRRGRLTRADHPSSCINARLWLSDRRSTSSHRENAALQFKVRAVNRLQVRLLRESLGHRYQAVKLASIGPWPRLPIPATSP